ncbi:L,D-transpeptidase [Pseudohoeflea coraliihabitans]|uniref:L,D-transpeptidase n=1 Tax=Pseudohoeflea coraliihabitans TaxID=2860393 RepID=A0ABS6WMF1_9HYPH|nr:L,D-transpeptidase [Pseudohoeflea sp. DP4N28-3]MBW3097112.1 L,D-transpeptidase [Pseudohoeflea sp. DP4N28-3]
MRIALSFATAGLLAAMTVSAFAGERYGQRPPVVLSPDLSAPWVMQLSSPAAPRGGVVYRTAPRVQKRAVHVPRQRTVVRQRQVQPVQRAAYSAPKPKPAATAQLNSRFLPQTIDYPTSEKAGTIVIDTNARHLYLVLGNGKARRYGVGVGKPGFEWAGTHRITQKREWPGWTPPKEMIERVRVQEGRILPKHMKGGPGNPLGARAMYLGSTLYRIHGTNQPWTIGQAVSSGCIRMRNEDVIDLYERAKVGAKVIVS